MSISNIRKAFVTEVKSTLDGLGFGGKIKWENRDFDPTGSPEWAGFQFVSAEPFVVTLGQGGDDRLTGYVQIDLNTTQDSGDGAMDVWIDAFRQQFPAGKPLTYGNSSALVLNTGVNSGTMFDNWFRKSITITYRADLPRALI
jgi:hypothetical protein|tara:strand:- start:5402 stop:5830 length:429 start_codon:yes stop_codon:yes gene_type:complete